VFLASPERNCQNICCRHGVLNRKIDSGRQKPATIDMRGITEALTGPAGATLHRLICTDSSFNLFPIINLPKSSCQIRAICASVAGTIRVLPAGSSQRNLCG